MTNATHIISSGNKVGRVLSRVNATEIQDAMTRLQAVLVKAGFGEDEVAAQVKEFGEKCGYNDTPSAGIAYMPYGGAISFKELDAYEAAQDKSAESMALQAQFAAILGNIMDRDLAPKELAAAVRTASDELEARLSSKAGGSYPRPGDPDYDYEKIVRGDYKTEPWMKPAGKTPDPRNTPGGIPGLITRPHEAGEMGRLWKPEIFKLPQGRVPGTEKKGETAAGDNDDQPRDERGRWTHKERAVRAFKAGNPEALIRWFNEGADGQIEWGESGSFDACVDIASEHMDEDQAKGFCNLRHHDATGHYPGEKKERDEAIGAFHAFKDTEGRWRFIATWSNNFKDLDGEVFPESAHKEFEQYVDRTGDFPELWLWHVKGSKCGRTDMIAYDDGFCLATGTFDEDKGDIAESLARAKNLGVSHGYTYDPSHLVRGVYQRYRTFEISPLPAEKAANVGTAFTAWREEPIMLTAQKRAWLEQTIGPERAAQIEENTRRTKKELEARGVSFKEFVEALKEGEGEPAAPAAPASEHKDSAPAAAPATGSASPTASGEPGDGEKAGAESPPAVEGMKELLDGFKSFTEEIGEWRKSVDEKLEALRASDDSKIADAWKSASRAPALLNSKSATQSTDNVIDGEKAKTQLEALGLDKLGESEDPASPYVADLLRVIGRVPVTN